MNASHTRIEKKNTNFNFINWEKDIQEYNFCKFQKNANFGLFSNDIFFAMQTINYISLYGEVRIYFKTP